MRPTLLSLVLLAACTVEREGDPLDYPDGQPDSACTFTEVSIDAADATALGFSADDVVAAVAGLRTDSFVYHDGTSTPLDLELSAAGDLDPILVDGEPVDASIPPETCPDRLRVALVVDFSTADGAFAESIDVVAYPSDLAEIPVGGDLAISALAGTWASPDIGNPTDWDSAWLSFGLTVIGGDQQGRVDLSANRDLGGGMGEGVVGPVGEF